MQSGLQSPRQTTPAAGAERTHIVIQTDRDCDCGVKASSLLLHKSFNKWAEHYAGCGLDTHRQGINLYADGADMRKHISQLLIGRRKLGERSDTAKYFEVIPRC
jgi:hypothetical protein